MQEGFGQVSTEMRPKRSMQGQIVEVEGGRIIRALGRKDRHSKVCTAKGPKDRRVRLSANTAIRFYDVQDRLGYDRPSKAIDWLMNEAKAAIEALNGDLDLELPPTISNPSTIAVTQFYHQSDQTTRELDEFYNTNDQPHCGYQSPENRNQNQQQNVTELIQTNSLVGFFNSYTDGLNSRNRNQAQDLCLALQSYQEDPMILPQDTTTTMTTTTLFSANLTPLDFEGTAEMVQFQRMVTSNSNPISSKEKESEAAQGSLFEIDSSLPRHLEPNILDQNHSLFSHREPLQSSFSPSIQASFPPPNSSFGIGFANDGFLGFSFPQQEEKQLSSATSLLHYQD